ncbi:MAG: hypothetical protein ACKVY0_20145 [Prosthecobacter sp.]|uniref:hypothetical protein n=1 Tax=Prosthecobacter sp. TaxID=1965333 RepID=UPI0039018035
MFNPQQDDLYQFLSWRKKTRFLRRYGGPLLALLVFIACIHLIWQAYGHRTQKGKDNKPESRQAWQVKIPAKR